MAEVTGPKGVVVTIEQSREATDGIIRQMWLVIGGVALLAIGIAFVLALVQSRRLARPLVDLATTAARIGSGDPRPMYRRYGIRELDQVGGVLDDSVARVAEMLASERRFATDASHQLRTPLTALSMRLEEILVADDPETIKEEATVAIAQVERLAEVVDRLLAEARQSRTAHAVSLHVDVIARQQVTEWTQAFAREGRELVLEGKRSVIGLASPGGLSQVLATLLENSLVHGGGTTSVLIRTTATKVVIEVADQGPGVPPELAERIFERSVSGDAGTGLGLAVARDLAEADGGRLQLQQGQPTVFAVFLTRPLAPDLEEPGRRNETAETQRSARRDRPGRWRQAERVERPLVVDGGHPFRGTRRYRRVRDRAENPGAVADEPERRREHQADDVGGDVVRERAEAEDIVRDRQDRQRDAQADGVQDEEQHVLTPEARPSSVSERPMPVPDVRHRDRDQARQHLRGQRTEVQDHPKDVEQAEVDDVGRRPDDTELHEFADQVAELVVEAQ